MARKGTAELVDLSEATLARAPEKQIDVLAVNEALTELEALDPRKGQILVMKYFGGKQPSHSYTKL